MRKALVLLLILALAPGLLARERKDEKKSKMPSLAGIIMKGTASTNPLGYDPVPGAEISIQGTDRKTVSNEGGYFEFFELEGGDYTLNVMAPNYAPQQKMVRVANGPTPTLANVTMLPVGTMLVGNTPVGPGTAYIAFAAKGVNQAQSVNGVMTQGFPLTTQDNYRGAILNGADPLALNGNPVISPSVGPGMAPQNPVDVNPNSLMMIPSGNLSQTGYHTLGVQPYWLCFNVSGTRLYLSDSSQQIQVLDTVNKNQVLAMLPAQGIVTDLRLSGDGNYLLVSVMSASPGVLLVDTRTNQPSRFLPLPPMRSGGVGYPNGACMAREGGRVFVAQGNAQSGEVTALDGYTGQPVGSCPVGAMPTGIAMSVDGRFVYTANSASGDLSVVDTGSLSELGRVRVGVSPQKVAVSPNGMRIWVTNKGSNSVTMLDGRSHAVLATIPTGSGPVGVACSPDSSKTFVTCKEAGTVVILDGASGGTLQTTTPLPNSSPFGVAVKP